MSTIHTQQAWASKANDSGRLGLLALAEIVATESEPDLVTLQFSALTEMMRLTGWDVERVSSFVRFALGLQPDFPLGGMAGSTFHFSQAVAAVDGTEAAAAEGQQS